MSKRRENRSDAGRPPRERGTAEDRLIDANKPTPGQAEGERDPNQQSERNRDEGDRSDRDDNL
jgi:hypothetical protein